MKLSFPRIRRLSLWWPVGAVLVVGGGLSAGLYHTLREWQEDTLAERVDQQVRLFSSALEQRLQSYADIVQGLQPLLEMQQIHGQTKRQDVLGNALLMQKMPQRYPGVLSFTYTRRLDAKEYPAYRLQLLENVQAQDRVLPGEMPHPDQGHSTYYVIDRVWPMYMEVPLVGMDVRRQPQVLELLESAVGSRVPMMSAPTQLLQMPAGTMGVLISMPVHKTNATGMQEVVGFTNLSISIESMMDQLRARGLAGSMLFSLRDVGSIYQKIDTGHGHRLVYASPHWDELSPGQILAEREVNLLGRVWRMQFAAPDSLLSDVERNYPQLVAGGGLLATLLLAALVGLVTRQRLRAEMQTLAKHKLLRHRSDRFKALFHQSAVGVAEIEPSTGRFISVNTRFCDLVGYGPQALEQLKAYDLIHPDDLASYKRLEAPVLAGTQPHCVSIHRIVLPDERVAWVEVWASPLIGEDGLPMGRHILMLQDVTERKQMQEQLQAREAYSSEMLRYMPVGLVVVGAQGRIEFFNHQFEVMTGWMQGEIEDESCLWRYLCVDAKQHASLLQRLNAGRCEVVETGVNMPAHEYLLRNKSGQELPMEVSGRFLDGRILLTFVDLSQRKAAEAQIQWLDFYDTLTQLPNRKMLLDRLGDVLGRCQRTHSSRMALLLLDIDNFKALNETLGHQHGDDLLRMVATRLLHSIADKHTLARQGGDEFAVVLEDLPVDALEAGRCTEQVGQSILEAFRTPFYLGGQDLHVTVSMGAVVLDGHADTVEELLKRADLALYQAKSVGRDTLQFFDPSMQKAVSARVEMEKDLRLALDRHEFDLYYQPQVFGSKVVGAEALLRWRHPVKGFISPGVFVPAAEESGLILPLGEWVLYAACRQLAAWAHQPEFAKLTMSVNVSPRQFYQPDFVQQVQQALEVTGAKAQQLELELTEGMLLTDVEDTIRKMVQLKSMGIIFSLDDFGTGYSSMSYLKRLPLDKLKIDQSFVREVTTSANDASIARTIVALGHSLGLKVIAEGVETRAQCEFLKASGCMFWQGYLFSRPTPAPEFEQWVQAYEAGEFQEVSHA